MLQIIFSIPYLLIFVRKYREFVERKYNPWWGFVLIALLIFYSPVVLLKFAILYLVVVLITFIKDEIIRDIFLFLVIWLPVEFGILPLTNLDSGEFAGYLVVVSIFSHILLSKVKPEGLDFSLQRRSVSFIFKGYVILAAILIPIGLFTGFIKFAPSLSGHRLLAIIGILFLVGYPEEMLFRALLFKILMKKFDIRATVILSAIIFGTAHLNGPHGGLNYFLMASIASLGYGAVYWRSRSVTASTVLHSLIDYTWVLFFGG